MTKVFLGLVLLLGFFSLSCRVENQSVAQTNTDTLEAPLIMKSEAELVQHRKELIFPWLQNAVKLINKTRDAEAVSVMTFLHNNMRVCMPNPKVLIGVVCENNPKTTNKVSIVPLLRTDSRHGPFWKAANNKTDWAHFDPDRNTILVKVYINPSELYQGVILLHEAKHAKEVMENPRYMGSPYERVEQEVLAREFQHRLVAKVGGMKYAVLVSSNVDTLVSNIKDGQIYHSPGYTSGLDEVFGPATTDLEKRMRQTDFRNLSTFLVFERTQDPATAQRSKIAYIARMVKAAGYDPNL